MTCAMAMSPAEAKETSPVEDSPIRSFVLIDQLEHSTGRYTGGEGRDRKSVV